MNREEAAGRAVWLIGVVLLAVVGNRRGPDPLLACSTVVESTSAATARAASPRS